MLQILASLSGCHKTARAVNLINTGKREDVYSYVVEAMNSVLSDEDKVDRDLVKQPLMTFFYNSLANPRQTFNDNQFEAFLSAVDTAFTGAEHVMEWVNDNWIDKEEYSWTLPDGHKAVVRTTVKRAVEIELEQNVEFVYEYTEVEANGNHRHLVPNVNYCAITQ